LESELYLFIHCNFHSIARAQLFDRVRNVFAGDFHGRLEHASRRRASIDFKAGASSYALCNMESLINELTNADTTYLLLGGLETKDSYFKGAWLRKG